MTDKAVLAQLARQAEGAGADLVTVRALVEEASEAGAARALGRLGLEDARARRDMDELRELLQAWRDAKRGALSEIGKWVVRIVLALLVVGMVVRAGILEKVT
ncbi:MAG TPA: DUF6127 family protein [Sphingomonadaceae bacterium]|nr:DUF6127 family protein [Sphingomonadaceae bacterium]